MWYIPVFPTVHSKKHKIRLVFDASAQYLGISINDNLYQGPDLTNRLRGVLLQFRERPVAIQADIQDIFFNFEVPKHQRDYLRFFWFKDNDASKPLISYRATRHIVGLSSSPAVANYGLMYCALQATDPGDPKLKASVRYALHQFYMGDGLYSTRSLEEAVEVLSGVRELFAPYNICLHKITSNHPSVLSSFTPSEVSAPAVASDSSPASVQQALGMVWDVLSDTFSPNVPTDVSPFTKRGVLATVNALGYDSLGLVSPVILVACR